MNVIRSIGRQRGVSAWTLAGTLFLVLGLAGLGVALIKPGSQTTNGKPISAVGAGKAVAAGAMPSPVAKAANTGSGPHPSWHGTWQGTSPDSKMVITAAGVEIFDVYENGGKKDKFHTKLPWVNSSEANGNSEESGYAKASMSLAEISREYESTVARFQRDPSDLRISDPTQSRRMIGRIKPGNYRVVWAYWGGDCGLRDMVLDGDLILSIVNCRYRHEISLFARQGATPPAVGQDGRQ